MSTSQNMNMGEWAAPIGIGSSSDDDDGWSEISSASDVESLHDDDDEQLGALETEGSPATEPQPSTLEIRYGPSKPLGAITLVTPSITPLPKPCIPRRSRRRETKETSS